MAYKEEVKTTYITSVICDKCKREQINHENKQKAAIEKFEAWSGKEV